jgi:DNA-binding IscR family transcriptional regulator
VGEVLRFVEGSRSNRSAMKAKSDTAFSDMWQRIDTAVSRVLDKTTFAELAREWKQKRSTYVPNWEI